MNRKQNQQYTMKNLKILTAAFLLLLANRVSTFAQSETTMQDILETVNDKVSELEDEKNQEIVNITLDLLVNQGTKSVIRYLDPAFDYTVSAFGDRRIAGLKLSVYKRVKDDWEFYNDATGANPQLGITPADFEQYRFMITIDSFKDANTTGHFALLIYHKNPEKKK
jgi:hypothetical protein